MFELVKCLHVWWVKNGHTIRPLLGSGDLASPERTSMSTFIVYRRVCQAVPWRKQCWFSTFISTFSAVKRVSQGWFKET